jgi:hypothetical protein
MAHLYSPVLSSSLPPASDVQTTVSPITGQPIISRPLLPSNAAVDALISNAHAAYLEWRLVPLKDRTALVAKAVDHLVSLAPELAVEITEQMGRYVSPLPLLLPELNCSADLFGTGREKWEGSKRGPGG